jgi:hypothetical protein
MLPIKTTKVAPMHTIKRVEAWADTIVKFLMLANAVDVREKKIVKTITTPSGSQRLASMWIRDFEDIRGQPEPAKSLKILRASAFAA